MQALEKTDEIHYTGVRVLSPYCHPLVKDLLAQRDLLFQLSKLHQGPVHLLLPDIMDENIDRMRDIFAEYDFDTAIHYTMKPNKSDVFARQAYKNGINIDVSSLAELQAALAAGFKGYEIGCTNSKNRQYLWLAMEHDCLISVDSVLELEWIADMAPKRRLKDSPVRILLRIADLQPLDRQLMKKSTKFGIAVADLPECYEMLHDNDGDIEFLGFHFHFSNPSADLQAGYLEHALRLTEDALTNGFEPQIIDIGGGYRDRVLEESSAWEGFVENVEKSLVQQNDTGIWANKAYGMYLNERGRISGRDKIQSMGSAHSTISYLQDMFENTSLRERPLKDYIAENLLTIMVEPGQSLLHQCGISLFDVKGVKTTPGGDNLIMLDASVYNIGMQFKEPVGDFILLQHSDNVNAADEPSNAYVVDNICNENGIVCKRRMTFPAMPQEGDLLVMVDTAGYVSDFEDAQPHRHPLGKKFVVTKDDNKWAFCSEENYWPNA